MAKTHTQAEQNAGNIAVSKYSRHGGRQSRYKGLPGTGRQAGHRQEKRYI
jgi:hypothetical protein